MKKLVWGLWAVVTLLIVGYYGNAMFLSEEKESLLIGEASYGHYQIEMVCDSCHTDPFGGPEVLQKACVSCHAEELKEGHDSHPKKKFNDPRNADRLEVIDARYCVTCHTEHQAERTHPMGVTIPEDYCFHCHQEVGEERLSHKDLAFDSCANAGCHNYHDNRALYERFLVENADQPWLNRLAEINAADSASFHGRQVLATKTEWHLASGEVAKTDLLNLQHWDQNRHVEAGISCVACHESTPGSKAWVEQPAMEVCASCHQQENEGFRKGRHGMRLVQDMAAISPGESRALSFADASLNTSHSCMACHSQQPKSERAVAVTACLGCHQDEHSLAFERSPHAQRDEESLTCATCHMPRLTDAPLEATPGQPVLTRVEHNQSANLRPNEKMIRPVCMQCHSLAFSIDALADETLIQNNFRGKPGHHVPSIDWALEREQ
ncbi:MAG: hypothetical protein C9356_00875 [Oleiphilus sp.]|nr:MAG: hypothetical protein C9356_00875 [Oleiphilus sp.]